MVWLAPGTLVDRYELISPIGEGGMAQVWVARQKGKHGFEKLFAFKCIHDRFAEVPAFRSMFLDEARIASAIEHPNVAQVYDLGESGTMLYLVIEYVDGESLGAIMTAASRRADATVVVPTAIALRIIADACAGIHAAHDLKDATGRPRGVVHRDVSPQNILVSVKGDVKVIDFGIAHASDRIGADTNADALKGKLHYMAPEQALHEAIGPSTDVFALGATLYRMLAGRPPFEAGNDASTLRLLLSGNPPTPLPEHVPANVRAIVERAIARDPRQRFATALEMQAALEAALLENGARPDVAGWVVANASDGALERRAQLATRTINIHPSQPDLPPEVPSFDAELAPRPARVAPAPLAPAAPRVTAPSVTAGSRHDSAAPERAATRASEPPYVEPPTPGIMDVRALVARAASQPLGLPSPPPYNPPPYNPPPYNPPPRPLPGPASMRDGASEALEIPPRPAPGQHATPERHAAPARDISPVGPATKAAPVTAGARSGKWMRIAIATIVLILGLAAFLLVLPMIVRDRILAAAREAGIDLTIERVSIGATGIAVHGVDAKLPRVPGATAHADEFFVVGLTAREVRVRGLDVKLEGREAVVLPALLRFYDESRARIAGSASSPRTIAVVSAHLAWAGLLGEGTRLEASGLALELESRGALTEDIRASVGSFDVKTKRTTFGPWAGTFDRSAANARVRLLFDPPVPDGPSALLVWGRAAPPHLTVKIPRSPVERLGLRLADLGLPIDPTTELALKLEGGQNPNMRVEGSGRLDLFGVRPKALKGAIDVKVEGAASGMPGKPIELEKTTATLGPFLANVTGTITGTDLGFHLDAAWRTVPIACEKLARAEARSLGPIAAALQELAHTTGAARFTGTANASGLVTYDTRTPDEATATMVARETCGLSIFGM